MILPANKTGRDSASSTRYSSTSASSSKVEITSSIQLGHSRGTMTMKASTPYQGTLTEPSQSKACKNDTKVKAVPKREAGDEAAADPDSSTSSQKRKRTRPVSACEACRVHKVRCILKVDQPICERCSAAGKECLFRIDDLRPDFRAERFAHLGPPGKDARSIKSKPKDRDRRARASATPATFGKASGGKTRVGGRGSDTVSSADSSASEEEQDSKPSRRHKETGVLSGAAADETTPQTARVSSSGPASVLASADHPGQSIQQTAAASPPFYIDKALEDSRYAQPLYSAHYRPQSSSMATSQSYGSMSRPPNLPIRLETGDPVYSHRTPSHLTSLSGGQRPDGSNESYSSQQQQQHRHPPQQSGFAIPAPVQVSQYGSYNSHHHLSHPRAVTSGPHSYHSPGSLSSFGSARSPRIHYGGALTDSTGGPAITHSPSYSSYRPTSSPSSGLGSSANHLPRPPSTTMSDLALPSIRTIVPTLRHEDGNARSPPYHISRGSGNAVGKPSVSLTRRGSDNRRLAHPQDRSPATAAGSPSSQSSASRKQVMIPFFRWFGSTANTPGYRRIKVAVNPDLPLEEDDDALPDDKDDTVLAREASKSGSPSTAPAILQLQTKQLEEDSRPVAAPSSSKPPKQLSSPFSGGPNDLPSPRPRTQSAAGTHFGFSALDTESTSSASRDLFDPSRPRYPRPDILLHLSELFVQLFRTNLCPWVESEALLEGARNSTLPSILANSICAMTARFSDWAELHRKSPRSAGDPFSEMAKTLIVPMLSWPSLDVIEALILLSYAEFGAGSDSGLWMYSGMGMRMATDLGLQHESTMRNLPKANQEKARWLFWSGCYAIDRITCFGTGRPVTLLQHTIDCLPPRVEPGTSCFYASQIIQLLQRRGRMGELLNGGGDLDNVHEKKAKLMDMWHECAVYFQSLPSSCAFSVQSFKRAASKGEGPAFLFLHVLFQSTISLLERPGIMRGRNCADIPSITPLMLNTAEPSVAQISASASRSIADMIGLASKVDPKTIETSPYLDQLILPTGRAFNAERKGIKAALEEYGYSATDQSRSGSPVRAAGSSDERLTLLLSMGKAVSDNLHNCITWLGTLAHYWGGASWPARALEQEAAGVADIMPDERDADAMQAPLRDMELLSAWARDKVKQAKSKMASRRGSADHTRGNSSGSITAGTGTGAVASLTGMSSPGAATSIERLLAAANARRGADDPTTAGATDGLIDHPDDNRALGHALSGRWAASAELNLSALLDFWAEEQQNTSLYSSYGENENRGEASGRRAGTITWADDSAVVNPATPSRYLGQSHPKHGTEGTSHGHVTVAGPSPRTTLQYQAPNRDPVSSSTPQQQSFLTPWMATAPSPLSNSSHHPHHHQQAHHPLYTSNLSGSGSSGSAYAQVGGGGGNHLLNGSGVGTGSGAPDSTATTTSSTIPSISTSHPLKGFSSLQLEEFLSADLISGSGIDEIFPLDLPDEPLFPHGEMQDLIGSSAVNDNVAPRDEGPAGQHDVVSTQGTSTANRNGAAGADIDPGGVDALGGWGGLSQQHLSSALFGFL